MKSIIRMTAVLALFAAAAAFTAGKQSSCCTKAGNHKTHKCESGYMVSTIKIIS